MRRRDFITLLCGATTAWPLSVLAQASLKIAQVGFLGLAPASGWAGEIAALRAGLRELGYVEGKNIVLEFRWAEGVGELPRLAAELVRMNVDIIVAPASTQVEPARQATRTIPIVFAQHADPVGTGHVLSLAHPGGNITGVSMVLTELAAKGLEILKQALPSATRIGILSNPTTPSHVKVVSEVEVAAKILGLQLLMTPVRTIDDFDPVFSLMKRERADGFLVPPSPLTNSQPVLLAELALQYGLPGMFGNKDNVKAGGLMSYGADFNYMYRHAAIYIDKILKGEKPSDLPVEQASKYDLVLNLKTARALGLDIPPTVLARADEVIE
jgi:putative tryptophan/tyrosine transport system substrate-binding protein